MADKKTNKNRFKNGRPKKGLNISFSVAHKEFFQLTSAEREENLNTYYVDNRYYQSAIDPKSKKAFFIGRTGTGKTAILEKVRSEKVRQKNIISIDPEDFAFKIMERSSILGKLTAYKINLDFFYKTMWQYIFVTEILKQEYGNRKKNWFEEQILKYRSEPVRRAYKFLQENDELDDGCSFNEKIDKIVTKLESSIKTQLNLKVLSVTHQRTLTEEDRDKIHDSIKQFEFAEIRYFIKHLDEDIISNKYFFILVDDLDKNWIQNEIGINFTRCLFETIFEINNSKHLRLLISLRTNLFNQLDFNQREKFHAYIEYVYWNNEEIKSIVEERFKAIGLKNKSDVWKFIFPQEITSDNGRKFKTFDYLLSRSNNRPRDILFFISHAIDISLGKNEISAESIRKAEGFYSKGRLSALEDEWKNPYLNIGKIFGYFRRCSYKFEKEEFMSIVESITLDALATDEAKKSSQWSWLIEGGYIDRKTFGADGAEKLVRLLYQIGLIGIREVPSSSIQYIHNGLDDIPSLNKDTKFYINPCYWRALNVTFH